MQWYLGVWKKYADFSGRARRTEYWMFVLFNILAYVILYILSFILPFLIFLPFLYGLAVIVPTLAVIVRRLHDSGRSGGWFFITFVPFVGSIILLVFMCLDSEPQVNKYGAPPKASNFGPPPAPNF